MKKLIYFALFALIANTLFAQPEDKKLNKITFLMVDREYEDAAKKTQKLLEDPYYRRNAWAYYYLSQSMYEIAQSPEFTEDYPKAFRESMKAAYKLTKYREKTDENMDVYKEAQEFLKKLKDSAITVSEIYYDNEKASKAAYYLKSAVRFAPNDYALWLMKGIYEIKARNVGEGVKSIILAMDSIHLEYVPDDVSMQTMIDALDEYVLIVKSGEYDKYFTIYKFNPTTQDVNDAIALRDKLKGMLEGDEEDKEARKKESEIIYKTFRSEEEEDDEMDDE